MHKYAVLLALLMTSCASGVQVQSVSISQVVSGISDDLHKVGAITVHGSEVWTPAEYAAFDAKIRQAQCYAQSPDPVVPLIQKDVELTLEGQFTATGNFSMASGGMGMSAGRQQTITVPVTFTAISDIPGLVASHEKQVVEGRVDQSYGKYGIRPGPASVTDQFQAHIDVLISTFNPATCPSVNASVGPLMMAKPAGKFVHRH